jgi:RNA polymerase sigma factor for flagellar operon FliA
VEQAAQELATQLGRWPTVKELAMKLGSTVDAVQEIQQHAASRFVSLERSIQDAGPSGDRQRVDPVDTDERADPASAAEQNASLRLLRRAVESLSPRDQAILRLRYEEARPFHEVGRLLGLSESRVCQIHKRILRQLRQRLGESLEEAA